MKIFILLIFLLECGVARAQDVSSIQQRASIVDKARKLLVLQPLELNSIELEKKNPFYPLDEDLVQKSTLPGNVDEIVTDRDLLKKLTSELSATGSMQLGGVSMLLFGQKKFKVGDLVLIVFQGSTYELEIMSIERTSYTLRYKNEQINLPIKTPANIPVTKS